MALYQYKAMDQVGRLRRGHISASNLEELEARMARMGLDLITCKTKASRNYGFTSHGVKRRELITFCFQLEHLIGSGVPLLQALTDVRDTLENGRFREVISSIAECIVEGKSLSTALDEFPHIFDRVFVNLVRVGEQSGELVAILRDLTETLRWQDELAARTKTVLTYPAFVAAAVIAVVVFLMVYLVPQLVQFIGAMEVDIPIHTRALLALSQLFVEYGWWIALLPPATVAILILVARHHSGFRMRADEFTLRVWIIGDILHKLIMARFSRVVALMYRAGVPVLDILRLARLFVGNKAVEKAIEQAIQHIGHGESISGAFEKASLFPPLVLRMVSVGENTGSLDKALLNVSYFYERHVQERINQLEAVAEPFMTVLLGATLGWIMLAVLGPVYDLVSRIVA